MKKFNNYAETQSYQEFKKLPVGGYVFKVQQVRFEEGTNGNSDRIILAGDIDEGDYKGYFKEQFDGNTSENKKWKGIITIYCPKDDGSEKDGWTKRAFKTIMENFEASNPGFHWNWDETKLKGLVIGAIYGEINTVIDGNQIKYVGQRTTTTVDNIRAGAYSIPKPQYKNGASETPSTTEDFISVSSDDEELPF